MINNLIKPTLGKTCGRRYQNNTMIHASPKTKDCVQLDFVN